MYQKNFVICDEEPLYAKNLMEMIQSRKELGFQMQVFHQFEQLEKFASQKPIQILLIGEAYPKEARMRIEAKEKFVLVKGENRILGEGEHEIYKYQSVDKILSKILEFSMENNSIAGKVVQKKQRKLIGIYSPIHRIGKTKFALEMGKELAGKSPVLYLNLEEYAGGTCYFSQEQEKDLGDLLYYVRHETGNLGLKIRTMAEQMGELDYIRPMSVVQDLQSISTEEWLELFKQVMEKCVYEVLILDLGDSVQGLYEILNTCDTVYTPYIDEPAAKAKLMQYTENLRKTGYESILEHTIQKPVRTKNGGTAV